MAYQSYTLADLRQKLADRTDNVPFWDETEAKDALNEALYFWNVLTGMWKVRGTIATIQDQDTYTLPTTMTFGMRVEYNNSPLAPTSMAEMDEGRPGWQGQSGTPKKWIPVDLTTIIIWPAPDTAAQTLTIDGVSATPVLTYDADYIDIGTEQLNVVVGYALHILAFKEGGIRFKATETYFTDFLAAAAEENTQLTYSELFRKFLGIDPKLEKTRE